MTRPVVVVSSLHRFAPENLETSPLSMRIRETSAGQEGVGVYLSVVTFFLLILVRLPLHLAHLSFPIARTFFNCFLSRSFLPSTLQKKVTSVQLSLHVICTALAIAYWKRQKLLDLLLAKVLFLFPCFVGKRGSNQQHRLAEETHFRAGC